MYVLLVGVSMLDRYFVCDFDRLDQASSVPRGELKGVREFPGGAGNTFANLRALGIPTKFVTCIGEARGDDQALSQALDRVQYAELEDGSCRKCVPPRGAATMVKNRIMDGQGRTLLRYDQYSAPWPAANILSHVEEWWREEPPAVVVISDYGKGFLSEDTVRILLDRAKQANIPTVVDPCAHHGEWYYGVTWLTPNEVQAKAMLFGGSSLLPAAVASRLGKHLGIENTLLTRGPAGMLLRMRNCEELAYVPAGAHAVADATGAGDTVVAGVVDGILSGLSPLDIARHASLAASLVVTQPGTAVAHRAALWRASVQESPGRKHVTLDRAAAIIRTSSRKQEGRGVAVNGCFDLLHEGHRHILRTASALGGLVVAVVNSDKSVRRIKGANRPIQTLQERIQALAALPDVHLIVSFEEDHPTTALQALKPAVVLRGKQAANAWEDLTLIRSWGGEIRVVDDIPISTTELIRRMGAGNGEES